MASDYAANVWLAEYAETGKVGVRVGDEYRWFRAADAVEHAGPE